MNSCLYRATVMHHRFSPKPHRFHYQVFMFYVDLDELDLLQKKLTLIGNVFSYRKSDHLRWPLEESVDLRSTKEHLLEYLTDQGIRFTQPRIMLLTNFRTFGYQFNPVSFYFCLDGDREVCAVAEVGNTFGEKKLYLIKNKEKDNYYLRTPKYFYVSPFIDHDADFEFLLKTPAKDLNIRIDDLKGDNRFFISTLTGKQEVLSNAKLWFYAFRFPFLTLQVIGLIHWNAFRLWLKRIPYHKKTEHPDLQRDQFR